MTIIFTRFTQSCQPFGRSVEEVQLCFNVNNRKHVCLSSIHFTKYLCHAARWHTFTYLGNALAYLCITVRSLKSTHEVTPPIRPKRLLLLTKHTRQHQTTFLLAENIQFNPCNNKTAGSSNF